ncbi:MAG TPA: protein kinase family protein [Pseudonocardiaceae bacterium]
MTGKPTDHTAPRRNEAGAVPSPAGLTPGVIVGEGRYRLLAQVGADVRCGAELWRARDGALGRDVALTILTGDPANPSVARDARRSLERAMHIGGFIHPGMARVLDVLGPGPVPGDPPHVLGIVVAEWTQGRDLVDLLREGPLQAPVAARLLRSLAAAVEAAHHTGLVLGTDHPQRIRVTPEGEARLAFPCPRPEATPRDDVRGVGAVLYLMLTGYWALPGGRPALPPAPVGPDGVVVAPRTLVPTVPHELSAIAVRSLVDTSIAGVRTGAAILQVLERVVAAAELEEERNASRTMTPDGRLVSPEELRELERRRKLGVGMAVLITACVVVLGWLGFQMISLFTDSGSTVPPLVVGNQPVGGAPPGQQDDRPDARPVDVDSLAVYNVKGDADNAEQVGKAVDGDPDTSWKTEIYQQQFPQDKPGIGLRFSFREAVSLAQVNIDSPSDGTVVEIRAATSEKPDLKDTVKIGEARLVNGRTEVHIDNPEPVRHVVLWITELSGSAGQQRSEISEVEFLGY